MLVRRGPVSCINISLDLEYVNHSLQLALIVLQEETLNDLKSKEDVKGIFLDFAKAFDTVDHKIILMKSDYYIFQGTALQWMRNYLSNRSDV